MSFNSNTTCIILRSSGLPKELVYPILNEIRDWDKTNGTEWTIDRLKHIKQAYVHHINGSDYFKLNREQSLWIANKDGLPSGVFKPLFRVKKPQKALSALMVYTSQISKGNTYKQGMKFLHALEDAHTGTYPERDIYGRLLDDPQTAYYAALNENFKIFVREIPLGFTPVESFLSSTKRTSYYNSDKEFSETIAWSPEVIAESLGQSTLIDFMDNTMSKDEIYDTQTPITKSVTNEGYKGAAYTEQTAEVGVIKFIQEPGYKLRSVAIPHAGYQFCLSRLGNNLYDSLHHLASDVTFDQDKGIRDIQDFLKNNPDDHLVGLDLSSASDRIPLDLTNHILREKFPDLSLDIDLFIHVSKGDFNPLDLDGISNVNWKVGQPLGTYPSFAAMAITHHAIVGDAISTFWKEHPYLDGDIGFYRILGDDVVVHSAVKDELLKSYETLGISVNKSKSTDFEDSVEFAGRIITKDKTFVQPKWNELSDRSFVDLARNLGPSVKPLLRERQLAVVELFANVPKDLHPYGMGWNPDGLSYDERTELAQDLLDKLSEQSDVLRSKQLDGVENLNNCYRFLNGDSLRNAISFAEPENSSSLSAELESVILHRAGVVSNVDSCEKIEGFIGHTVSGGDPRGISTLQVIEDVYSQDLVDRSVSKDTSRSHF